METLSVPLVGYQTDYFPSFWLPTSEFKLDFRCESASEIASIFLAQRSQGSVAALLVANPVPAQLAWNREEHDLVVEKALMAAKAIEGKAVTPFMLDFIVRESAGKSLEVNLALVKNNIQLAAQIATELNPGGNV
jgi:pseudouridine-5'-phosphate glycosidase